MKILITGTKGLALALYNLYVQKHDVTMVSKSTGHDIKNIDKWGNNFLDCDLVFNNAYENFYQVDVLNFFYDRWKNNSDKSIINIGSRCIVYKKSDHPDVWQYRQHKQALQYAVDSMLSSAKCDLKIINPGLIDTEMVSDVNDAKFSVVEIAEKIKSYSSDKTIKRVDLWL